MNAERLPKVHLTLTQRVDQAERRALSALLAVRAMHRRLSVHDRCRDGSDSDVYCACCSEACAYAGLLGRSV